MHPFTEESNHTLSKWSELILDVLEVFKADKTWSRQAKHKFSKRVFVFFVVDFNHCFASCTVFVINCLS